MEPINDLISNVRTRLIFDEKTENNYTFISVENKVWVQWGRNNGFESDCVCPCQSFAHYSVHKKAWFSSYSQKFSQIMTVRATECVKVSIGHDFVCPSVRLFLKNLKMSVHPISRIRKDGRTDKNSYTFLKMDGRMDGRKKDPWKGLIWYWLHKS